MPSVYVHYVVDGLGGITDVHFSGSRSQWGISIRDKNSFTLAVTAVNQIATGKRHWDAQTKVWSIDNDYWQQIITFYQAGHQIFELVPYTTIAAFKSFITGTAQPVASKPVNGWSAQPVADAASSFFNNFNTAVERIAVKGSERDTLAELLGLANFAELDRLDKNTLRKLYRSAALRLHPDRNAGDGSRMATLNQLWGVYVQPTL